MCLKLNKNFSLKFNNELLAYFWIWLGIFEEGKNNLDLQYTKQGIPSFCIYRNNSEKNC